jgi:predicted RNase H-like HicB family nuclease
MLRSSCDCTQARHCVAPEYPENKRAEMRYAVVIESTETGYSSYVPDLPGCVSVGRTREEMDRNIREAIELYLDELREQGAPIPQPTTDVVYVAA